MTPKPDDAPLAARTRWEKAVCFLVFGGSLIYYWLVFFHYALDAGQADDFVDVLWFFEIFRTQDHWLDKLAVIALPNHEHVTIFNHLVYLADYALFGKINFFHYMLAGHLIILACCFLLAEWLQRSVGWWYALALGLGIFLNLFYWQASFWAMTALSNQAVILFALLAARSLSLYPSAIAMPCVWALLAATTQFNGLLIFPALIFASFLAGRREKLQPEWRQLLLWTVGFLAVSLAYVLYENPFARDHLWRQVGYTDPGNLVDYIKPMGPDGRVSVIHFLNVPATMLSMLGASVFNLNFWAPAVLSGALLLLALWRAGAGTKVLPDRFWWVILFFILGSAVLVAVGRGFIFGPSAGLLYRYRLYSFLALVLVVRAVFYGKPDRLYLNIALAAAFIVQCCSIHVLDDINEERTSIKQSHYYWMIDGGMGRSSMPFYPHNQDWRLFNAYQNGYYNPYNAIDRQHKPAAVSRMENPACANVQPPALAESPAVKAWSKKARALAVEISLDIEASEAPVQLLFCDNGAGFLVELDEQNINRFTGKYWPTLVLKNQLPPAQYRVTLRQAGVSDQMLGLVTFP